MNYRRHLQRTFEAQSDKNVVHWYLMQASGLVSNSLLDHFENRQRACLVWLIFWLSEHIYVLWLLSQTKQVRKTKSQSEQKLRSEIHSAHVF